MKSPFVLVNWDDPLVSILPSSVVKLSSICGTKELGDDIVKLIVSFSLPALNFSLSYQYVEAARDFGHFTDPIKEEYEVKVAPGDSFSFVEFLRSFFESKN